MSEGGGVVFEEAKEEGVLVEGQGERHYAEKGNVSLKC